ncbi:MAG: NAD(P)-binding protein [Candidatus Hodarchaeales archaeon]
MKNQYDAIVIGSGIGGVTVVCNLAKMGKKVVMLEKIFGKMQKGNS